MTGYRLIVNKSTVPIGSHQVVAEWMAPHTKHPFDVCSNPEFLKEGSAVEDFLKPDRVVIGTEKEAVYEKMAELYAPFVRQGNPVIWMDPVSAEITKYACNSFLATRISFMNELSRLCEKTGGDIELVRKGMTTDVRIGKHFLYAGVGYGGSCFPKDVQALLATARRYETPMGIIAAAEEANARQKRLLADKVRRHFGYEAERQDLRPLGPRVQTQYRRPARSPGAHGRARAPQRGRQGPGLRSGGDAWREEAAWRRGQFLQERVRGALWRRCFDYRDRVERVPASGFREASRKRSRRR